MSLTPHIYKLIATRELRMSRSPMAQRTAYWDVRMCMKCGQMQIREASKNMRWEDRKIDNLTKHDKHFTERMSILKHSILERADGKTEYEICAA